MLYLLWPNFGHMTDTGECEGQIGCLAPEVRQRKQSPTPPPFPGKNTGSLCLVRWNCCSYLQQQEKPYIHLKPQQTPKDTASVKQGSKAVITHSDLLFIELSFSASTTVHHEKLAHSHLYKTLNNSNEPFTLCPSVYIILVLPH